MTLPVLIVQGGSDKTPDAFSFTNCTGADINATPMSNSITPIGYNSPTPVYYDVGSSGSNGVIINGNFTYNNPAYICPGQTLALRMNTSSYPYATTCCMNVCIGPQNACTKTTWCVTTRNRDETPNPYSAPSWSNVTPGTSCCGCVQITGLDCATVQVFNAAISVNNGGYTTGTCCVCNNQYVCVCVNSSGSFSSFNCYCLYVGPCASPGYTYTCAEPMYGISQYVFEQCNQGNLYIFYPLGNSCNACFSQTRNPWGESGGWFLYYENFYKPNCKILMSCYGRGDYACWSRQTITSNDGYNWSNQGCSYYDWYGCVGIGRSPQMYYNNALPNQSFFPYISGSRIACVSTSTFICDNMTPTICFTGNSCTVCTGFGSLASDGTNWYIVSTCDLGSCSRIVLSRSAGSDLTSWTQFCSNIYSCNMYNDGNGEYDAATAYIRLLGNNAIIFPKGVYGCNSNIIRVTNINGTPTFSATANCCMGCTSSFMGFLNCVMAYGDGCMWYPVTCITSSCVCLGSSCCDNCLSSGTNPESAPDISYNSMWIGKPYCGTGAMWCLPVGASSFTYFPAGLSKSFFMSKCNCKRGLI